MNILYLFIIGLLFFKPTFCQVVAVPQVIEQGERENARFLARQNAYVCIRNGDSVGLERILGEKDILDNLDESSPEYGSLLHYATSLGHVSCMELLIKKGSNSYAVDNDGETALHKAARNGNTVMCNALLETQKVFICCKYGLKVGL